LARVLHRRVVVPLLDFVLPSTCFCCHARLRALQRFGACAECWASLRILRSPLCPSCGLPQSAATDLLGPARGRCAACVLLPRCAAAVRAAVSYDAHARSFLLRAKLGGRPELFGALGVQLARTIEATGFARECTVVLAVPSSPWITLRRGFSPADEIARPVVRRLLLPWRRHGLARRLTADTAFKRLGARRRRLAATTAFRARTTLRGERVLLVDDIMTTGASAEACARVLSLAGATEVRVAVWARTLPQRERI
jgi:predicted amidophosphoribosyltransferase